MVNIEAVNQLNELEQDLNVLANENMNDWDKLIKWDLPDTYKTRHTRYVQASPDQKRLTLGQQVNLGCPRSGQRRTDHEFDPGIG